MEKVYKSMGLVGASNIALGIIIMTIGLVAGILSIVGGGLLLKRKADITF